MHLLRVTADAADDLRDKDLALGVMDEGRLELRQHRRAFLHGKHLVYAARVVRREGRLDHAASQLCQALCRRQWGVDEDAAPVKLGTPLVVGATSIKVNGSHALTPSVRRLDQLRPRNLHGCCETARCKVMSRILSILSVGSTGNPGGDHASVPD